MTDDYDDYDEDDFDDEDDVPTYICPECGGEVFDDCACCPYCELYIIPVAVTAGRSSMKPMWYIFLGMLGILATLFVVSGAIRFFIRAN